MSGYKRFILNNSIYIYIIETAVSETCVSEMTILQIWLTMKFYNREKELDRLKDYKIAYKGLSLKDL
jgi:hypothetical protein